MLRMSYRLSCKGQLEPACCQIKYQHNNKQSTKHA